MGLALSEVQSGDERVYPLRRLEDTFGDAANSCRSLRDLNLLLATAAIDLGFRYFALLHHSSLDHPPASYVRMDNYPVEWVEEIVEHGLVEHDPVHLASRRTNYAFEWAELGDLIALKPRQVGILERSRHYGIGEGLTVPVNVPGEPAGSCSFAMALGTELPHQRIDSAYAIGSHAFKAARRLIGLPHSAQTPQLSRREVQCVRLMAAGKTYWEVAAILGISVETVRKYVKRAMFAYGVSSKPQLVALAIRDGWAAFEDVLESRH